MQAIPTEVQEKLDPILARDISNLTPGQVATLYALRGYLSNQQVKTYIPKFQEHEERVFGALMYFAEESNDDTTPPAGDDGTPTDDESGEGQDEEETGDPDSEDGEEEEKESSEDDDRTPPAPTGPFKIGGYVQVSSGSNEGKVGEITKLSEKKISVLLSGEEKVKSLSLESVKPISNSQYKRLSEATK